MACVTKQFVLAGDAIFTIKSPDGKHRTYRVTKVEANDRWPEAYFVKTLTGPQNTDDYAYVGRLDVYTGQVSTTAKSRSWDGTTRLKLLNRVLARVWGDDHDAYLKHGYYTYHAGRCGRCARLLTVPSSIESGIGPECSKLMAKVVAKERTAGAPVEVVTDWSKVGKVDEVYIDLSDWPTTNVSDLTPVRDAEGEVTHWSGERDGVKVTVFND